MTDIQFETLVDQLFEKHATHLGRDPLNKGQEGLDFYTVQKFAKELKDILEKKISWLFLIFQPHFSRNENYPYVHPRQEARRSHRLL